MKVIIDSKTGKVKGSLPLNANDKYIESVKEHIFEYGDEVEYKTIINEYGLSVDMPIYRDLTAEELSSYRILDINSEYSANTKSVTNGIPDDEVLTFPIQKEEAKAWLKDNNEPTPFIDGMLTKRTDVTKVQLVNKIIEKAYSYAYLAGAITGERQAKEKQILGE